MPRRTRTLERRDMLRQLGLGLGFAGASCASWVPALAEKLAEDSGQRRHCILLWMSGGPSQIDTFDMKPDDANGGEFKEVATNAPGLRFSEHLPLLGKHADRLAVIRSLSTKEGDHVRGTHLVRTGHPPMGGVEYPSICCSLAKELEFASNPLPSYVSVAPPQQLSPAAFGPGFLGPKYAAAVVAGAARGPMPPGANGNSSQLADLKLENIEPPSGISGEQHLRRLEMWNSLEKKFLAGNASPSLSIHHGTYQKAVEMMRPEVRTAFNLADEPDEIRRKYGTGQFGQGCLLARRLVERGVPFVEVALGDGLGWDTHLENFKRVKELSAELDAGWGTLMTELSERGLLDRTTIVWMGEFGRTPAINNNAGRDHFPNAWSCVLGGGGIKGGQAYGKTSKDGTQIEENPVAIGDVLATLSSALGVPPESENVTPGDRPIKIAEGKPISAILA
jgi:hypothetical protein